jgi:hypothetical protein
MDVRPINITRWSSIVQMQVQNSLCSLFDVYAKCDMMQLFLIYAKKIKNENHENPCYKKLSK